MCFCCLQKCLCSKFTNAPTEKKMKPFPLSHTLWHYAAAAAADVKRWEAEKNVLFFVDSKKLKHSVNEQKRTFLPVFLSPTLICYSAQLPMYLMAYWCENIAFQKETRKKRVSYFLFYSIILCFIAFHYAFQSRFFFYSHQIFVPPFVFFFTLILPEIKAIWG